jgi:hypothetical protein
MASPDVDDARRLGAAVGSSDHDDLTDGQLDALDSLLDDVDTSLPEQATAAASALLGFWGGHVAANAELQLAGTEPAALDDIFETGFQEGALGVDLYQALSKTAAAVQGDGPSLDGWVERLEELTNRHVAHLLAHGEGGHEAA